MKRPSAINTKVKEEIFGAFPSTATDSKDGLRDESPYALYNNAGSDSDSFSESSRKIRKKRNTYQKISDDIRVDLLESVRNGETLKAAAKRHKINYSSAKSILHTFRKEGRILKKSAQERTTKKKTASSPEPSEKPSKSVKKENEELTYSNRKSTKAPAPLAERKKFRTDNNPYADDETTTESEKGLNAKFNNLMKTDSQEKTDNIKASIEAPKPLVSQQAPLVVKEEVPMRGMSNTMHHEETPEMNNYIHAMEGMHPHHMTYGGDSHMQKGKLFDNFFMNSQEPEGGAPHHYEGHDFNNYMYYPREFDSFNDMVTSLNGKPHFNDEFSHHAIAPLCPRGFNMPNTLEDKFQKTDNGMLFDESGENYTNCPLRSFMDTQNMFREALRKASFFSYNGNTAGYRKGSLDFF